MVDDEAVLVVRCFEVVVVGGNVCVEGFVS